MNISPKVYAPALVNLIIGGILLALGEKELGVGLLLAVATTTGVGYAARDPKRLPSTFEYDADSGLPVE